MELPEITSPEEWRAAHDELLATETRLPAGVGASA